MAKRKLIRGAITVEVVPASPFSPGNSRTLSARITKAQMVRIVGEADRAGQTVGAFARTQLVRLTSRSGDPEATLKDVIYALDLPEDSTPAAVLEAVKSLVTELASNDDPLAQQPDAPPAQLTARRLSAPTLTADDRAIAARLPEYARQKFIDQRLERAERDRSNAASTAHQQKRIAEHEAQSRAMIDRNKKAK